MFRPPPLRVRVQYGARRLVYRAHALARRVAFGLARIAPGPLAVFALALIAVQPSTEPVDRGALLEIAGIVATVLSLGFTVTLLVAQHTAERHARALYAEFRREGAWLHVLAWLFIGVVVIVAASLLRPTLSTAFASLALAVALGLYAASLLPRLLDSLDPTKLAERLADRSVAKLREIARSYHPVSVEGALKPVAAQGIEMASGIAVQGISSNDKEVARAGFAGMRQVLVAYVEGSPTRGWDTEIINLAFQNLDDAVRKCLRQSPVLILPAVVEELTALGEESQRTLEVDGNEAVSGRLNSLFLDIVRETLVNEESAGAAMAAAGIGTSAMALIRARSPNVVADHIRKLRLIALAAINAQQDHVAGRAHVELSKIAVGLASMDAHDVMPPSLFQDACSAFADSVEAFTKRTSTNGTLMSDLAWSWVTMAHTPDNLAHVVVAGVAADGRGRDRYGSDFGQGARALTNALVALASKGPGGLTKGNALQTAYLGVQGAMVLKVETSTPDLVPELWDTVVRRLVDPQEETLHEVEILSALLLAGTYEAESPRGSAARMRVGIAAALAMTTAIRDERHRRRRARAWLPAGRAALGCGDQALAQAIAAGVGPDLRGVRSPARAYAGWDDDGLFDAVLSRASPLPDIPDKHTQPEVIAAFKALLDKHRTRRPGRRTPTAPSRPSGQAGDEEEAPG
ncbi:MAG TPA: hypothetical protein VGK17_15385 [Propionicimonas sp.]|jgi:hypothetical protein